MKINKNYTVKVELTEKDKFLIIESLKSHTLKQTTGIYIEDADLIDYTTNNLPSVWYLDSSTSPSFKVKDNINYIVDKGKYIFKTNVSDLTNFLSLYSSTLASKEFEKYFKMLINKIDPAISVILSSDFASDITLINNISFLYEKYIESWSFSQVQYLHLRSPDSDYFLYCSVCGVEIQSGDYFNTVHNTYLCIFCFKEQVDQELNEKIKLMNQDRINNMKSIRLAKKLIL
jgi:hypothetical protein